MNRYYVEFAKEQGLSVGHYLCEDAYVYVYAYSENHVRDIFGDYELVAIDQTDQEVSMSDKEIDVGLLIAVVNQIELDADDGDYTAIECLFQYLDAPEERLKGFLREDDQHD